MSITFMVPRLQPHVNALLIIRSGKTLQQRAFKALWLIFGAKMAFAVRWMGLLSTRIRSRKSSPTPEDALQTDGSLFLHGHHVRALWSIDGAMIKPVLLTAVLVPMLLAGCGRSLPSPPEKPAMDGMGADVVAIVDTAHAACVRAPKDLAVRARLGRVFHANGFSAEARKAYGQVVAAMPSHGPTLYQMAMLEREQGNAEHAGELLRRAIDASGGNIVMQLRLGNWAMESDDDEQMMLVLESLRRTHPQHPAVRVLASRHALKSGQPQRVVEILSPMVGSNESHPYWRYLLGRAHQELGNERAAYRLLATANSTPQPIQDVFMQEVMKEKRGFNAAFRRAEALQRNGDFDGAIKIYRRLMPLYPDQGVPLLNAISQAHFRSSDLKAARDALDRALELDAENAETHLNYAVLLARDQPEEAVRWASRSRALDPGNPLVHDRIARLELARGNPEESLAAAEEAIRLGASDPGLFIVQTTCLMQLNRPLDAARSLRSLLEAHPMYDSARMMLVDIVVNSGGREEAIELLEQGLTLRPGNAAFLERLRGLAQSPAAEDSSP